MKLLSYIFIFNLLISGCASSPQKGHDKFMAEVETARSQLKGDRYVSFLKKKLLAKQNEAKDLENLLDRENQIYGHHEVMDNTRQLIGHHQFQASGSRIKQQRISEKLKYVKKEIHLLNAQLSQNNR